MIRAYRFPCCGNANRSRQTISEPLFPNPVNGLGFTLDPGFGAVVNKAG